MIINKESEDKPSGVSGSEQKPPRLPRHDNKHREKAKNII